MDEEIDGFGAEKVILYVFGTAEHLFGDGVALSVHLVGLFLHKEFLSFFVDGLSIALLDDVFFEVLLLDAEQYGDGLAAQPIGLFINAVADDDVGKQHAHHSGGEEDEPLHLPGEDLLREGKGDQEGEHRQIDGDDLIPLALLQG